MVSPRKTFPGNCTQLIIVFLILLVEFPSSVRTFEASRTTRGGSGKVCEEGFRKCLRRGVQCVDDNCECRSGVWRGDFRCYKPDEYHMEILNDPNIHPFTREFAHLPVPCRFLVTHFTTKFSGFGGGTCEVKIHAFNGKYKGKIFVLGFDLALIIRGPWPPPGELSIRSFGTATEGVYRFKEEGSMSFRPDGPWEMVGDHATLYYAGSLIHQRHDPYDNIAHIQADACGFRLELRPMDLKYGKDQILVPGLSLSVSSANDPVFQSQDTALALAPKGLATATLKQLSNDEGLDHTLTMVNRLFMGRAVQNHYQAAPACSTIPDVIQACPNKAKRNAALNLCFFLLAKPRVVYCLDKTTNGQDVLHIFQDCVEAICDKSQSKLEKVKWKIRSKKCDKVDDPEVELFLKL